MDQTNGNLVKPLIKNGRFENPWSTWKQAGLGEFLYWKFYDTNHSDIPTDENVSLKYLIKKRA
jgi:hypothetical protein